MNALALALLLQSAVAAEPAAVASPPVDPRASRAPDLVEVITLDPSLRTDVRYATANNFTGRAVYAQARVFLQRPAAEAVVAAHRALAEHGYGLLLFDGYRPWRVTKLFWEVTPREKRDFVANPARGSKHNRGCAVDLTLFERKTGREVAMPSAYDDFTEKAAPDYAGGTAEQRAARDLLRRTMERFGFSVEPNEWWHYNCAGWQEWPLLDVPFEDL